ncbi:antibiotic biosynthesis monooxygenase [Pseudomonas viridiflava]|uniref:antibiotic biosynthesis monooxygenase n=1 Tax=Pseudomonas viridiflava TaxID=33069 RepID=UPI001C31348E|nr:antibiotic biosynthesis monooxygenase [Pseudomonas viridiflava]QXG49836.1 antibiotic biosynthesis monooxygenase [Pseudomonas viridiflava]
MSEPIRLDTEARVVGSAVFNEVVTLVIKHRVKAGQDSAYESWLRRIVTIASGKPGHLGVDVIRAKEGGLQMFTSVLRFHSTQAMQDWLNSDERKKLVQEAEPMLADGDQTLVNPHNEFWFTPTTEEGSPPPRWKQACVSFMVILPLTLFVPLFWGPIFARVSWLSSYFVSTALVTITIVLLVVYLMMPAATRLMAPWLSASAKKSQGK